MLLLKWSVGDFGTVNRKTDNETVSNSFFSLLKTSIYSFQQYFDAVFTVCYNGHHFAEFLDIFHKIKPFPKKQITFINQRENFKNNPYSNFFPLDGVWWKSIPFRLKPDMDEIYIDSDIICVNEPKSWLQWWEEDAQLITSRESIQIMSEPTCGELCRHPVLQGKVPLNCGIIGQKAGTDLSEKFYELTKYVEYGTYNGNFIIEQGVFNLLYYSVQQEGIEHYVLPYESNLQARDIPKCRLETQRFETIHFTASSKGLFYRLQDVFIDKIENKISDERFFASVIS